MEARRKGRPRPGRSPPSKPSPELTRCRRPVRLERAGLFVCTASRERPAIRDTGSAGWGSGPVEGGSGPEPHPSFIKVFCGAAALALGAGLEEASWPSRLRAPPAGRLAGHGGVGETHSSRDCQGVRPSPPPMLSVSRLLYSAATRRSKPHSQLAFCGTLGRGRRGGSGSWGLRLEQVAGKLNH